MIKQIKKDSTGNSILIYIKKLSDGTGLGGLSYTGSGLVSRYARPGESAVGFALQNQTVGGAYLAGGFCEVLGVMAGVYRFDIHNEAVTSGVDNLIYHFSGAADMEPCVIEIMLIDQIANINLSKINGKTVVGDGAATKFIVLP